MESGLFFVPFVWFVVNSPGVQVVLTLKKLASVVIIVKIKIPGFLRKSQKW
jgi:hypothetical protein